MKHTRAYKKRVAKLGALGAILLAATVALGMVLLTPNNGATNTASLTEDAHANGQTQQRSASSQQNASVQQNSRALESVNLPPVPLDVGNYTGAYEYQAAQTLESWQLTTTEECASYALSVLESIKVQNLELVEAGFLDVSGQSWGCVVVGPEGESLQVTLIPERPFSSRSDENPLVVRVLRYGEVEGL